VAVEFPGVPPAEAVELFRRKKMHVGFDWRDTDAAWHLRSFTVAKAMHVDVLADIRTAVDRAIADGRTFREWQGRPAYWPRTYVLDRQGRIRFDHIGEGAYDELFDVVDYLLTESV
jgi:uncharacterized protein with gpF-like domain